MPIHTPYTVEDEEIKLHAGEEVYLRIDAHLVLLLLSILRATQVAI